MVFEKLLVAVFVVLCHYLLETSDYHFHVEVAVLDVVVCNLLTFFGVVASIFVDEICVYCILKNQVVDVNATIVAFFDVRKHYRQFYNWVNWRIHILCTVDCYVVQ